MRYVSLHTTKMNQVMDEELELFRRNHFVPCDCDCPVVPVGLIIHHSNHFFAVIFDFERHHVYVLGRNISTNAMGVDGGGADDWNQWRGPEYWRRIAALHGWGTGDVTDVSLTSINWKQNGVDCGPIACSVLEQCLASGLDKHGGLPVVQVQCGHQLRIRMLRVIAARIKLCCSDYLMLLDSAQDNWQEHELPHEDVINAIQNGQHQAECLTLLRKLAVVSATCSMCQHPMQPLGLAPQDGQNGDGATMDHDGVEGEWSSDEDELGLADLPAGRKVMLSKPFKVNKLLAGSRNCNDIVPCAVGTNYQRHLRSNKRFPRPIAPPPLAAYASRRWLQENRMFNNYERQQGERPMSLHSFRL